MRFKDLLPLRKSLTGTGRKTIWFLVALFSWICAIISLERAALTQQAYAWKLVVASTHALFLVYLTYFHEIKPLKLPLSVRLFSELAFILVCMGLTLMVDFWGMLFGVAICFHLMPLTNLMGAFENFTFLDCALAILVAASGHLCKQYPRYSTPVITVDLAVLILMRHIYEDVKDAEEEDCKRRGLLE